MAAKLGRSWYHPGIGAKAAERLLHERGKKGSFLVRPSQGREGQSTLTLKWEDDTVYHLKLYMDEDAGSVSLDVNDEQFSCIPELLVHYMMNPLTMTNPATEVQLMYPLNNPDPTNERWFHGYKTGDEAIQLLTKYGKRGSYLVRESRSAPGNYVLCVRTNRSREPQANVAQIQIFKNESGYVIRGTEEKQYEDLNEIVQQFVRNTLCTTDGLSTHLKYPLHTTLLTATDIKARIEQLERATVADNNRTTTGFQEEFNVLESSRSADNKDLCTIANDAKNKPKNRYKNILPFNDNRVTLEDGGDDYINASYIRTKEIDPELSPEMYIATQGCLANTMVDFWRMVLQETTRVIVMTTKLVERGKNKCAKYYPDDSTPERVFKTDMGDITVRLVEDFVTKHYILRQFTVERDLDGPNPAPRRSVFQYHFITWPDFGVPKDPASVLMFLADVKEKQKNLEDKKEDKLGAGAIIVHCSAGIGRTGTFIVLDILLRQLVTRGLDTAIDIQEMIRLLRRQREGMIQTDQQYRFIYKSVEQYISTKLQRINASSERGADVIYENIYGMLPGRKS